VSRRNACVQIDAEDDTGNTALHLAAAAGSPSVCAALIARQANANARNMRGNTPLHLAFAENNRRCAHVLLAEGEADVEDTDNNGRTAIHIAFAARLAAVNRSKELGSTLPTAQPLGGKDMDADDRVAVEVIAGTADDFAQRRVKELSSATQVADYIDEVDEVRCFGRFVLSPALTHALMAASLSMMLRLPRHAMIMCSWSTWLCNTAPV